MSGTAARIRKRCVTCGFEAPAESDEWARVDHPPFGTLMQCPECGSTNILTRA